VRIAANAFHKGMVALDRLNYLKRAIATLTVLLFCLMGSCSIIIRPERLLSAAKQVVAVASHIDYNKANPNGKEGGEGC